MRRLIRRPWIVLGLTITLLLFVVWAAGIKWALRSHGVPEVMVWKGSVTCWWSPRDSALSWGPWDFHAHDEPTIIWTPRWRYDGLSTWFTIPLWIPLVLVGPWSLWAAWRRRFPPGHCRYCGYDLRGLKTEPSAAAEGLPARCPECGDTPRDPSPTRRLARRILRPTWRRVLWTTAVASLVAAIFLQSLWFELTWYGGVSAPSTPRLVAPRRISLCHGGVSWREGTEQDIDESPEDFMERMLVRPDVVLTGSPNSARPPALRWTRARSDLWLYPRSDAQKGYSVHFLPGWLFVLAAAALTWLLCALMPRKVFHVEHPERTP